MKKEEVLKLVNGIEKGLKEYKHMVLFTTFFGCACLQKIKLENNILYVYDNKDKNDNNFYCSLKLKSFKNVKFNGNNIYIS